MTNEQLAIVLVGYRQTLRDAIKGLESQLPADMMHRAKDGMGFMSTEIPVTKPLWGIVATLDDALSVLNGNKGE